MGVDIEVDSARGNRYVNLTIDPEVANELFSSNNIQSGKGGSLFSGLTEYRALRDLEYEEDIRNIRTMSVVFSSPEFR